MICRQTRLLSHLFLFRVFACSAQPQPRRQHCPAAWHNPIPVQPSRHSCLRRRVRRRQRLHTSASGGCRARGAVLRQESARVDVLAHLAQRLLDETRQLAEQAAGARRLGAHAAVWTGHHQLLDHVIVAPHQHSRVVNIVNSSSTLPLPWSSVELCFRSIAPRFVSHRLMFIEVCTQFCPISLTGGIVHHQFPGPGRTVLTPKLFPRLRAFPMSTQVIVIGGGLAGMSAAHSVVQAGGRVLMLDKSPFCGGNSTKATSGINAAGTSSQVRVFRGITGLFSTLPGCFYGRTQSLLMPRWCE